MIFKNLKAAALILADIAAFYVALFAALFIRYGLDEIVFRWPAHFKPFTIILILWVIVFYIFDLYAPKAFKNRLELARLWVWAILIGFIIAIASFYIFESFFQLTPKTNLIVFTLLFGIFGFLLRAWQINLYKSPQWQTRCAILGDSENLKQVSTIIEMNPTYGYKNMLWIKDVTVIQKEELIKQIKEKQIELLVIHPELMKNPKIVSISYNLLPLNVQIRSFADFYEEIFRIEPLEDLGEEWFIKEIEVGKKLYDTGKRSSDLFLSLVLLIVFSPLFLIITALIKLTSPGPAIFKQIRVGRNGTNFNLYKFRTMKHEVSGSLWTEKKDPRITPVGKILRASHLDELLQLFNIIKGDISFVGPRPERVELAQKYSVLPHYDMRHIIRPGLTGWAQLNFKASTSVEEAKEKLKYDLYYVKNRSFVLDLLIMLKTIRLIFQNH